jgi:hypothetical protein
MLRALAFLVLVLVAGCTGTGPPAARLGALSPKQLAKTDVDRFTEIHQQQIFRSLRRLALKLYRRNPAEWHKSGASGPEGAVSALFDRNHAWRLEELNYRRGAEIVQIALNPDYPRDRVRAFIVGLGSMVQIAFNERAEFFLTDHLDAQTLYNAARNVEIAAWKLGSAKDADGHLLLLSNEMGKVNNLSFEREFGRVVGSLDVLSEVIAERSSRCVVQVVQNLATAVFLPLP